MRGLTHIEGCEIVHPLTEYKTMASKKNKNNQTDQTNGEPEVVSEPVASKPSLRPYFSAYKEADAAWGAAKAALEQAAVDRSMAVKAILEAAESKGPFKVDGQIVQIVSRVTKSADGDHTTYFFKGQRQDVVEID